VGRPTTKSLQATLETDNPDFDGSLFCGFVHQPPNAVVSDEVHQDFFTDHFRRSASQNIHPQGCLDVAEKQFNIPPLEIEFGKLLRRILLGVQQGGNDIETLCPETRMLDRDTDLSQGEFFREVFPCVL
jgi:hypothetical protein